MTHPILTGWQQTIPRTMTQHDVIELFQFTMFVLWPVNTVDTKQQTSNSVFQFLLQLSVHHGFTSAPSQPDL